MLAPWFVARYPRPFSLPLRCFSAETLRTRKEGAQNSGRDVVRRVYATVQADFFLLSMFLIINRDILAQAVSRCSW